LALRVVCSQPRKQPEGRGGGEDHLFIKARRKKKKDNLYREDDADFRGQSRVA